MNDMKAGKSEVCGGYVIIFGGEERSFSILRFDREETTDVSKRRHVSHDENLLILDLAIIAQLLQ